MAIEGKGEGKGKGKAKKRLDPALISSHSWANDVVYQRIYQLDGVVAPRTDDAHGFVSRWARHKAWFEQHAPEAAGRAGDAADLDNAQLTALIRQMTLDMLSPQQGSP